AVCSGQPVVGLELVDGGRQGGYQAVNGQGLQNDAGGEGQYLFGLQVQQLSSCLAGLQADLQTAFTRAGIGVAGVDDQGTNGPATVQVAFADLYWGRAEAIACENARNRAAFGQAKYGQVFVIG